MKSHQITIKDIARTLGISVSTVSRALKDHPDISPETKNTVRQLAESVGYRSNALALGLRKNRTFTIGVIVPEIVHHFFSTVISGIDDAAYAAGYNTIICQSNESCQREAINTQALIDNRVDGILASVNKSTTDPSHLQHVIDSGIPLVFFDRVCAGIDCHRVITDDFEGARIATNHLIATGCRRIMHLTGPDRLLISKSRRDGYCTAMREHGLDVDPDLIIECDSPEAVVEQLSAIVTRASEIDGIFAINDSTAIAAMQLLQSNGYSIPADVSVMGFGDGPLTEFVRPTLTTVEQKGYDIGFEATQILIRQIDKGLVNVDFETRVFTPKLHQRSSTHPLPDARN